MMNPTDTAPFDPDFDADNPYITDIPERFIADEVDEFEADWAFHTEAIFDPDLPRTPEARYVAQYRPY